MAAMGHSCSCSVRHYSFSSCASASACKRLPRRLHLFPTGASLLILLSCFRLSFNATTSPRRLGLYVIALLITLALVALGAALTGRGAELAFSTVHEHWPLIELLLPPTEFACTGHREQLFTATVQGELAIYTALLSAAMLLLLLLLLLAFYTHLDPTRPKPSSRHSVLMTSDCL